MFEMTKVVSLNMPTVSILITNFNGEQWLEKSIESAISQDLAEFEVLVYDDGSTDGSLEILRRYDTSVRWFQGENRGGNVARNQLLGKANGTWVQFLDSDDELLPAKIQKDMKLIDPGCQIDAIYSPPILRWMDGLKIANETVACVDESASPLESWFRWQLAQTGAVLWKRESLLKIGGWNENQPCCQDNEVTARALQAGFKFRLNSSPGAVYRIWSRDTVSHKNPFQVLEQKERLLWEMYQWIQKENKSTQKIEKALANAFFDMARSYASKNIQLGQELAVRARRRGFFAPSVQSGSRCFNFVYRVLGFVAAERVAAMMRRWRS